jgi:hypothetical protein
MKHLILWTPFLGFLFRFWLTNQDKDVEYQQTGIGCLWEIYQASLIVFVLVVISS